MAAQNEPPANEIENIIFNSGVEDTKLISLLKAIRTNVSLKSHQISDSLFIEIISNHLDQADIEAIFARFCNASTEVQQAITKIGEYTRNCRRHILSSDSSYRINAFR